MNIIFVGKKHGQSRTFVLKGRYIVLFIFFIAAIVFYAYMAGAQHSTWTVERYVDAGPTIDGITLEAWKKRLEKQKASIKELRVTANEQLDALTLRLGELQAKMVRLDALGSRLTEVAKLENGEFDFQNVPALGGPNESGVDESYELQDLKQMLDGLERQIADREQQLDLLNEMFVSRSIEDQLFIAGRPISRGWMSSQYGYRTDPFSGKRAWHAGVDFAGKEGSEIIAVASGIVTWASDRYGYGQLVEISHSGKVATRYAHCKEILVKVGDVVQKGQVIARMGSTGRSTGPHVHFEVVKENKSQNPIKYINRASR
ncbi:MAG: peptidoglycan DD-metalloendopeptidase family protein [Hahellaceae bacterium]|jgi:murein DD-endopeptidase MepM/ murein hydrolase activator NlpD|nr:peptidoglycan DD-metalloendopeptidase family protein [Hahellaceae bacterium]MCP5210811.1 peptidoglycan DD-metalloendopeptidase family protein [Hahellaceae bacterium]